MKNKRKITGLIVLILAVCALIHLAARTAADNEPLGDTGWTIDQFIEWAEKVQPVVGHRRSMSHKGYYETIFVDGDTQTVPSPKAIEGLRPQGSTADTEHRPIDIRALARDIANSLQEQQCESSGSSPYRLPGSPRIQKVWRDARKEWMDPNEPFFVYPMVDADDIIWYGVLYRYEWDFKLPAPYEKLPGPVRKILDSVNQQDVGRFTGEILPYFARPVAICSMKKGRPVFSEDVEVKLLSLSSDKLEFTVETEPFVLSEDPDLTGKVHNKIVLYSPDGTRVGICRPKKFRKENRQ